MPQLNNQTQVYFSASSAPGNFGATIYNRLFDKFDINAVYLPRKVLDAEGVIAAIKCLGVAGCSVSMPLKSQVVPLLDELDDLAAKINSVNTIVNKDGKLKGYNTDVYGAMSVLQDLAASKVLIYGAGSVTAAVITALREIASPEIWCTARRPEAAQELASNYDLKCGEDLPDDFDLVINATPASKDTNNNELCSLLTKTKTVFDLVVSMDGDTPWLAQARTQGLGIVTGFEMSKYQLQKQFEFYTGRAVTIADIDEVLGA